MNVGVNVSVGDVSVGDAADSSVGISVTTTEPAASSGSGVSGSDVSVPGSGGSASGSRWVPSISCGTSVAVGVGEAVSSPRPKGVDVGIAVPAATLSPVASPVEATAMGVRSPSRLMGATSLGSPGVTAGCPPRKGRSPHNANAASAPKSSKIAPIFQRSKRQSI